MKIRNVPVIAKLSVIAAAAIGLVFTGATPALAGYDDNFIVETDNTCTGHQELNGGRAEYVDYGDGLPGGGKNDDYIEIYDTCTDSHGVMAYAWLTRGGVKHYLGDAYDGWGNSEVNGNYVVWDPFKAWGNVQTGDYVGLKVCLVDGADDPTASYCSSATVRSSDG